MPARTLSNHRRTVQLAAIVAAAAVTAACASRPVSVSEGDVALTATGNVTAESPESMFADPKIAAVSSASNQDEIQTSQLAVQKATNAQVRQFAEMMVREHGTLEQQAQAMLAQKGMAPVDNALSLQKKRNLQEMLTMLRSLEGERFDREYVLHQIGSHMMTLHTLDTSLIPQADDPQLKSMLQQQVRPRVVAHLEQIKQIEQSLKSGGSDQNSGMGNTGTGTGTGTGTTGTGTGTGTGTRNP